MSTVKRKAGKLRKAGKVDWEKVRTTSDQDIARQIDEDPDTAPDLSDWDLSKAKLVRPLEPVK
jgi:hypothetical protein